ncbi:MAG: cobalamin B12-binding domain-containing protein [Armatimonadetes bacterium]|nr:cobalamin B12-binding domain-containing protein [Armatimonadota bacterium]
MQVLAHLTDLVTAGDRDGAGALVAEYAAQHGFGRVVADLFGPLLRRLDESRSADGTYPLAQVYVASKVVEDALDKFGEAFAAQPGSGQGAGVAVIGNIEDDCHALGRRLVGVFLRSAGWTVHDLGIDVPPLDFVDAAVRVGAPVIGVSAMLFRTADNIRAVRAALDDRGLTGRIQLAVGGAVFRLRPELVELVGGDGTVDHAVGAPDLFARLRQAAEAVAVTS